MTHKQTAILLAFVCGLSLGTSLLQLAKSSPAQATVGINKQINFQGKLVNTNGTNVPNGTYNIRFRVYDASSFGTVVWTEDRVYGTGAPDNRVSVTDGIFQVNLGSVCTLAGSVCGANTNTAVDFNSDNIYLTIDLGNTSTAANFAAASGNGEMSPRIQFTSSPYAFNADKLDGLDSTQLVQLAQGVQTDNTTVNPSIFINKTNVSGAPNIVEIQKSGADVFKLDNTGLATFAPQADNIAAFVLQRSGAADVLFTADTAARGASGGNRIKIGNSTGTDTATTILQVDATAADPTSNLSTLVGGLYYRSDTGDLKLVSTAGALKTVATDLQSAYNGSTSPASVLLTDSKNLVLTAPDTTTDPSILVNLQCATCSANGGRFGVQGNGTDLFTVNPDGSIAVAPKAGKNIATSLAAGSQATYTATAAPTSDLVVIDNTSQPNVTAGVNGLNIKYAGGAAAVEASGLRIDYTPGGTTGGVWSGMRVVANATGPASGVTSYGIKLEGPSSAGAGTAIGLDIASGFDIGLDIASGGMQLSALASDPPTPTAGNLRVYAKSMAGRMMLKVKGPSGIDYALQPAIFSNKIGWWTANGNATTANTINFGNSVTGTATTRNVATANIVTGTKRVSYVSSNVAGSSAGTRHNVAQYWMGNGAGLGGFYYVARFSINTAVATTRSFVGLSATTAALANADPSTFFNELGFGCNAADTAFTFIHNSGGGGATKDTLTGAFPCNTSGTDLYEARIFVAPNGTTVYYSLYRINTGDYYEGNTSANLPTSTTLMSPQIWVNNGTSAAAADISVISQYIETDN